MKCVALVRLSAMGDVVQALDAALQFRRARPDLEIHFVTQTENAPLLDGLGFDSVVTFARRRGWAGWRALRRELRALRCDAAVDLQGNWKSAIATRFTRAPERLGAAGTHRQERASGVLLNRRRLVRGPFHPAAVAMTLLREWAGGEEFRERSGPLLLATEFEKASVAAQLRAAGVDPAAPFVVYSVADPADNRAWNLAAMVRQASAESAPVVWLRGPGEREVVVPPAAKVLDQESGSLRQLIGLGSLVRAAGGRVFGPDHGPVHVLAATGAATTVLFGPQDPARTRPLRARVLTSATAPRCVPCRRRSCSHPDGPVCMDFTVAEGVEREL